MNICILMSAFLEPGEIQELRPGPCPQRALAIADRACLRHVPTHTSGTDLRFIPEFRVEGSRRWGRWRQLPGIGGS